MAQFLAAGFLAVLVVAVATTRLSREAADTEAVDDARVVTEVLARTVVGPAVPRGLVEGRAASVDRLDRVVLDRLDVPNLVRIKIWALDGTVLYSDETRLIGSRYPLGEEEVEVVRDGGTEAELLDDSRPENRYERGFGQLMEVYTRMESPEGEPLLLEAYYTRAGIDTRAESILDRFRPITLGALGALVAVTTPLVLLLHRRARRSADQRERLLITAIAASDAERTRIARDLHDGVVQDLAGTSYELSTVAARPGLDAGVGDELDGLSRSLRTSMRALRSLLVEIYPPDLHVTGLAAALDDLVSPLSASGLVTSLDVRLDGEVARHVEALTWRVVQEAVRNAARHSRARHLEVEVVAGPDGVLRAEVADDGVGFDPDAPLVGHFGLRGMTTLVEEAGGRLEVVSTRGSGTAVRMELRTEGTS